MPHTASGSQRDGEPSSNTEHDNATVSNLMIGFKITLILSYVSNDDVHDDYFTHLDDYID